jgi:hypothetical protein
MVSPVISPGPLALIAPSGNFWRARAFQRLGRTLKRGTLYPRCSSLFEVCRASFLASDDLTVPDQTASAVFLIAPPPSNATANLTMSLTSAGAVVSTQLNATITGVAILNLDEQDTAMMSITFVPGNVSSQLDIVAIVITVSDAKYVCDPRSRCVLFTLYSPARRPHFFRL